MTRFITTPIGRLRLLALMEGTSLLLLVFVGVPAKHLMDNPMLVKIIGPIHGALFLFFVFQTISVAIEHDWKFRTTTWKVLVACLVPFGTFYIDRAILRKLAH
jgi:integral membrane protein